MKTYIENVFIYFFIDFSIDILYNKVSRKPTRKKRGKEKWKKEYLKVTAERDAFRYENIALKQGIKADDLDYVIFKVSKQEGDFEDNLKEFLQAHPKFVAQEEVAAKSTGTIARNTTQEKESGVTAILKARYPELF